MTMPGMGDSMSSSPLPTPMGSSAVMAQPNASEVMSGYPVADLIAAVMQGPPGEDSQTGAPYDVETIKPVLKLAYQDLLSSREAYMRADKYFRGISPEVFSDPQLRRLLGLSESVYSLSMAAVPVKVMASRLAIASITADDVATKAIADLWRANKLHVAEHGFITDCLRYGDQYVIVWPDQNGDVQIVPNGPLTTRVFYDPEDSRTITHAIKSWSASQHEIRATLYFGGYIYKFTSPNQGKLWNPLPEPDGNWPMVNPYGQVPVFHFRAGDTVPYGTPEHADAYGPQDGLVKVANTLFSTIEFLGFPQRYALTELTDASGTAEFSDFDQEQPDVFLTGDSGRDSGLRQGPGELWALRAKSVGQFTPAESANFLAVWNQCVTAMAAATQTPMRYFADPAGQQPSGESLRAADMSLRQKIAVRQLAFGATWEDTLQFALKLSGVAVQDAISVQWLPTDPSDDRAAVAGVPMGVWKLRMGVPIEQVYRDLGYSDEEIRTWDLQPEDKQVTPAQLWPMAARTDVAAEVAAAEESSATEEDAAAQQPPELAPTPAPAAGPPAAPPAAGPPAASGGGSVRVPAHTRSKPGKGS